MVAVVFGGPSLEGLDLSGRNVTVLPPAAQGDLLRVLRELRPDAVGLLDCELPYRSLPTWHKEILSALGRGIPVVGAAAVGAHRAAELASQGMEGVGSIFRRVASGELERDDEVLGDWEKTPEGIRCLSVPLVTMRDALTAARERGVLSERSAGTLMALAEDLFWRERTWEALLEAGRAAALSAEELDALRNWLPQAPDPIRADAEALLARLEELIAEANTHGRATPSAEDPKAVSSIFKSLDQRDRPVSSESGPLRQRCIGDLVTFAHPEAEDLNGRALNRKLTLLLAALWDLAPTEREIDAEKRRLRRRFGLKSDEDLSRWMNENDLDEEELTRLLEEEALLHRLHRWFMQGRVHAKNTGAVLDELKLRGGYAAWKRKAARREALLQGKEPLLREERLRAFSSSFLHLIRDHLRAEGLPWHGALLPDVLPETGMELSDLLDELLTARTVRLILGETMNAAAGSGKRDDARSVPAAARSGSAPENGDGKSAAGRAATEALVLRHGEACFSRDRLGIEPLLYAPVEGGVVLGRTYEELFATGLVSKRWRREALTDFLSVGTVVFPEGNTFFEGIFEVLPGHDLRVSEGKASTAERETLPDATEELGEEALPLLRDRLAEALGDGLENAALCLSGGLDSSSVAAAWAKRGTPRCFIYGAPGAGDRERALETSRALDVTPALFEPQKTTTLEELRKMLRVLEIPVHIPGGPLPQFQLLAAMAQEGIRTVLSGQGGDELFCGYPWHFPLAMKKLREHDPETASRLETLHEEHPPFGPMELRLTRRNFTRTASWVNLNDGGACRALGLSREDVAERRGVRFFAADLGDWDALRRHGLTGRSLRYLLHYDHRLAHHFGLEGRSPLLADSVVDLVSRFRLEFLYGEGLLKYPLRRLFPNVPESVRLQARKTGFWHNSPELPDLRVETLRMLETTPLGDLVVDSGAVKTMAPGALWRFFSVGTLLNEDA